MCLDSCIRGYHVYNEIWTAVLGEVLITDRELHNVALGEYTLFFSPFRDLRQIDFSTSEFAAVIAEGINIAKDPLGSGRGPFCLK